MKDYFEATTSTSLWYAVPDVSLALPFAVIVPYHRLTEHLDVSIRCGSASSCSVHALSCLRRPTGSDYPRTTFVFLIWRGTCSASCTKGRYQHGAISLQGYRRVGAVAESETLYFQPSVSIGVNKRSLRSTSTRDCCPAIWGESLPDLWYQQYLQPHWLHGSALCVWS